MPPRRLTIQQIWPAGRARGLRRVAAVANRRVRNLGRAARHAVWSHYSTARYGERRQIRLDNGHDLTVRSTDFRAFRIAQLGGTQSEKVRVWRHLVEGLRPDVAVDVGANYGEFAMEIADIGIPTLALEPNPAVAACLRKTFAPFANVEVVECAAGDRDATTTLFALAGSSGSASLAYAAPERERRLRGRAGAVQAYPVAMVRLDDLISSRLGRVSSVVMKIDVEGFEASVLAGIEPLLEKLHWWRAIVEFGPDIVRATGADPDETWRALRRYPGVVVSVAAAHVRSEEALRLAQRFDGSDPLPTTPPGEVDVLIGRGDPTRPGDA